MTDSLLSTAAMGFGSGLRFKDSQLASWISSNRGLVSSGAKVCIGYGSTSKPLKKEHGIKLNN